METTGDSHSWQQTSVSKFSVVTRRATVLIPFSCEVGSWISWNKGGSAIGAGISTALSADYLITFSLNEKYLF